MQTQKESKEQRIISECDICSLLPTCLINGNAVFVYQKGCDKAKCPKYR
jgi:sulfatase maturation enzyme AslB (radical SAM superfamily)